MSNQSTKLFGLFTALSLLSGCFGNDDVARPLPINLTADDQSYFCGMAAAGHPGPKAQIHILGQQAPIWFAAARDAVGFMKLPDESNEVLAIYVTDMGKANWQSPESGPWIDINTASLVIDSSRRGGMGAPAVVPFADKTTAQQFIDQHGGRIVTLDQIPDDYVLGMVDIPDNPEISPAH